MINPKTFALADYLGRRFDCDCGHTHSIDLKLIDISHGAITRLPGILAQFGYQKPLIVCDQNTYAVAGRLAEAALTGFNPATHTLRRESDLVPDETACGELLLHVPADTDVIIAVGTGTLNDLCKYISHRMGLPYMVVATAPSMDGFASTGAPLIVGGMKNTYDAQAPFAIIGDIDILCQAPMDLITAGLGDTLGKYSCLLDWKISHIINGEYYCARIVAMVEQSLEKVNRYAPQIQSRSPQAIGAVMEALILTGIAMGFVGNSRPASGCEHHLSHYWEMLFLFEGKPAVLHGTKVGIGTVAAVHLYQKLAARQVDFDAARAGVRRFDDSAWEALIRRTYRGAAQGVLALEARAGKNRAQDVLKRIDVIQSRWPQILQAIGQLPPVQTIVAQLQALGAPTRPQQVGVSRQDVLEGVLVCKELRDRYTLLQLLFDLGLLEEMAQEAVAYFDDRAD